MTSNDVDQRWIMRARNVKTVRRPEGRLQGWNGRIKTEQRRWKPTGTRRDNDRLMSGPFVSSVVKLSS